MPQRQAIIFDMDGLMVDSEPLARHAWNQILQAHGHEMTDSAYQQIIGRRTDQAAQILLEYFPLPMTASEFAAQKTTIFHEIRAKGVPVMPGLTELQAVIKERSLPWAVATSSPREHATIVLAQLGLTNECQAIAAGDEVSHGKPAPDIYLLAAERLGVDPTVCLALEDSEPGCQAAAKAGMKVVAVSSGETKTRTYSCADIHYQSLLEVANHLTSLLVI